MTVDCMNRNMKLFSNLLILQAIPFMQKKDLTATLRQGIYGSPHSRLHSTSSSNKVSSNSVNETPDLNRFS